MQLALTKHDLLRARLLARNIHQKLGQSGIPLGELQSAAFCELWQTSKRYSEQERHEFVYRSSRKILKRLLRIARGLEHSF